VILGLPDTAYNESGMRALAAIAAVSFSLAAPASAAQATVPQWVVGQVQNLALGLGEPNPRITIVHLNVREKGRLVDHIWMRGNFTCNFCSPRHNTHADAIIDVHRRFIVKWHVWN
jgi:hypothetical protein